MVLDQIMSIGRRIPGVEAGFKWLTSRRGEGRIYAIDSGPMRGLRWRRENRYPYWYHTGRYEPHISSFIGEWLQAGQTYWDLGAHAGYHTLQGARAVGPGGCVLAVEPDPNNCRSLLEQVALNDLANVTLLQMAVADQAGTVRLVLRNSDSRGNALDSIRNPAIENSTGRRIEVTATTLDELAERYPAPHLLKMDIEGAEAMVLSTTVRLWESRHRPRCILLGYHGSETGDMCRGTLLVHGFRLEDRDGFATTSSSTYGTFIAVDSER
jgi:FkbM family methyltransferase